MRLEIRILSILNHLQLNCSQPPVFERVLVQRRLEDERGEEMQRLVKHSSGPTYRTWFNWYCENQLRMVLSVYDWVGCLLKVGFASLVVQFSIAWNAMQSRDLVGIHHHRLSNRLVLSLLKTWSVSSENSISTKGDCCDLNELDCQILSAGIFWHFMKEP